MRNMPPILKVLLMEESKMRVEWFENPDNVAYVDIEMGETVWLYVGETYPAYSIYWNE